MPQSLEERVNSALQRADRVPFDSSDEWYDIAAWAEEDEETNPPPAKDWAHRAARGIVEELSDDRGTALETAFHRERVDEGTRIELVEVIAEVIRQAYKAR
jgi:hypothetical protein